MRLQLADSLCYALLTITVTASCAQADPGHTQDVATPADHKKITKRETTLLIDNYPVESRIKQPKVIYRRISKYPPYRRIKQHYGQSSNSKYGVKHKNANYQSKKLSYKNPIHRNKKTRLPQRPRYVAPKHVPVKHSQKVRPPKTRYRNEPTHYSNKYNKLPETNNYHATEPTGFGEPPSEYNGPPEIPSGPTGEDEPLVDSYGAPLRPAPTGVDSFGYNLLAEQSEDDPRKTEYENHKYRDAYRLWRQSETPDDNVNAYTKTHPAYSIQKQVKSPYQSNSRYQYDSRKNVKFAKENPISGKFSRYAANSGNKPDYYTKPHKLTSASYAQPHHPNYEGDIEEDDGQIVVGGQYAEPPGRYIPKLHKPQLFQDNDEGFAADQFDSEGGSSGTVSTYVNYKNSNMAFSPQNLNDAFGPVVEADF